MMQEQIITTGEAGFVSEIKKRKKRKQTGYYIAKYAVAVVLIIFFRLRTVGRRRAFLPPPFSDIQLCDC